MPSYTDQMDREVEVKKLPQRIISLVPSQTELLFDLGLESEVIGITKFCIHPEDWFRTKERVGGTKNVDLNKIRDLKPDLIIGNKEENTKADIEALEKIAPVWMSDIYTLEDAYGMIQQLGLLCGKSVEAGELLAEIQNEFDTYKPFQEDQTVLYAIWNEPLMAAGKSTFIDEMLTVFGLKNQYQDAARYPNCDENKFENDPTYVFLSSEPYPFDERHRESLQKRFPKSKLIFVDGELFSWYGSRLKLVPKYFKKLQEQL